MIKLVLICLLSIVPGIAQITEIKSHKFEKFAGYYNFKITAYTLIKGGSGLSFGSAYWIERKSFQQGVNLSVNAVMFRANLGNKNRPGSRFQLNSVLSPISILNLAGRSNNKYAIYDDLRVFYFGNSNALMSRFRHHFALGSSFVLSPKSNRNLTNNKFNLGNIYSTKNRAQQLIYVGLKMGNFNKDSSKPKIPFSLKLCIYEDHMIIPGFLQRFADHDDRYFTGGGGIDLKFYQNNTNPLVFSLYNDVYTGNFERNLFDFPDIYDPSENIYDKKYAKRRHPRYVSQDPGQKMFNEGRFLFLADIPLKVEKDTKFPVVLSLVYGKQGGAAAMITQDAFHHSSVIDKINPIHFDSTYLYSPKKDKIAFERKHSFMPIVKEKRPVLGIQFNYINHE